MSDTVDDMYRKPAQSKNSNNHGQRLGCMNLPLEDGPWVSHELSALKLLAGHREDLDVDHQHYEKWRQDTSKEIEIHHIAHWDHIFKKTFHRAAAFICGSIQGLSAVFGIVFLIPPQEWRQPDAKGQDPEDSNDSSCSGPSDQTLIPVQKKVICYLCNQSQDHTEIFFMAFGF